MSFECKKCKKDFEKGFYILEGGWAFLEVCKACKGKYPKGFYVVEGDSETIFYKLESTEDMVKACC